MGRILPFRILPSRAVEPSRLSMRAAAPDKPMFVIGIA
jgi:hypothetical protein